MSKQTKVTHSQVQDKVWSLANSLDTGTHTKDGKEIPNQLTSKKMVSTANQFLKTGETVKDALGYGIGRLIVKSGYNLNLECFNDHYNEHGEKVNYSNTDGYVKAYGLGIRAKCHYFKTSASPLAGMLRIGTISSDSKKIKGIVHSVLCSAENEDGTVNELKIQHRDNFDNKVENTNGYGYKIPAMLRAIAQRLEKSETVDGEMPVWDIKVGKAHKKTNGVKRIEQSVVEWIVELRAKSDELETAHTDQISAQESKNVERKKVQKTKAEQRSRAKLQMELIEQLNNILYNPELTEQEKVAMSKKITAKLGCKTPAQKVA